jgi:hypothetical protein
MHENSSRTERGSENNGRIYRRGEGVWFTSDSGFKRIARQIGGIAAIDYVLSSSGLASISCHNGLGPFTGRVHFPIFAEINERIARPNGLPEIPHTGESASIPAFQLLGVPVPLNMTKMSGEFRFVDKPPDTSAFDLHQPMKWIRVVASPVLA